jgi:FdhD protein
MEQETEKFAILRITEEKTAQMEDIVAKEFPLAIILNNQELITLLCSPTKLDYLAIGFLSSEGLIGNKGEIKKILLDERRGVVRVEIGEEREFARELAFKRGCGGGTTFYSAADAASLAKVESETQISVPEVLKLIKDFHYQSQVYRATGGVHSAALCDTKGILLFSEDIGRHNALDKIFGESILRDISTEGSLIITSGRISSEILLKAAKRNIPIIISISAPTDLAVRLAGDLGITLIGFVREKRMNVYTNSWRVKTG